MDQTKKKQIKKITTWVLLAALVAGLAAMPLLAKAEAEADGPVATVHSGIVEEGTVHTTLRGGGTLVTEDIEKIQLPTGVKITEFLVKNGDTVTEGTPLAAVDKVSVMTAITSVTQTMEYLQKEMRSAKNEKVDSTISATAGGRIKKVFAQKGDSVQEVMLRDGALALLSLDGLMAVKIEKKLDIPTGETVTVTLAKGENVTGRIVSNLDGVIVITVEDKGYEIGQTVAVTGKDGTEIGSGELYVYNAWTATAYSGTIQTAPAKEETKVGAGSVLFTLTDTDFRGKLEYMSSLHREYEELMQDLFRMYNSGTIDAPCAGTISGIDKDSPHLLSALVEAPETASLLTVEEPKWEVVLLNATSYSPGECGSDTCTLVGTHTVEACPKNVCSCSPDCPANSHSPDCIKSCTSTSTAAGCEAKVHYSDCIHACDNADIPNQCDGTMHHTNDCIKSCMGEEATNVGACPSNKHYLSCIEACNPVAASCPALGMHKTSCIRACTHDKGTDPDPAKSCPATARHYPDCIKCCTNSDSASKDCPATVHHSTCYFSGMEYTARVALVSQVGTDTLVVRWDSSGKQYKVVKTAAGWQFKNPAEFNPALLVKAGEIPVGNPGAFKPGDMIFDITGYRGESAVWSGVSVYQNIGGSAGAYPGMGDLSGLMGSLDLSSLMGSLDLSSLMGNLDLSAFNFGGFVAPSPVEEAQLFDLEGSTLMTVSPEKTVSLTITLDEQDIAKVSVGQKATVKVEALDGEVFGAEVTEVSLRGTNSGGSSKFTAKLELPKAKDMLDGMSASASLSLAETDLVPTIPVAALSEQGARTVVYTALDEKTGEPTAPVPVTIGASDGITAQILEGLAVGDTYYYSYYDVLEEDTGVEERFTLT